MALTGRCETVGAEPGRSRPPLRTPGNRTPRRCPHAAAMTIGLVHLGLVTQACAGAIPPLRIARNEVIANASLRPISGFALRRRTQKSAGIGPVRRRPGRSHHRHLTKLPIQPLTNSECCRPSATAGVGGAVVRSTRGDVLIKAQSPADAITTRAVYGRSAATPPMPVTAQPA